jgi:hypothetical protein
MNDQLEQEMLTCLDPNMRDGDFGRFVNAVSGVFSVWHGIETHANRPFDLVFVAT